MIEMIEAGFRSPCLYTLIWYHEVYFNYLVLVSSFSYIILNYAIKNVQL